MIPIDEKRCNRTYNSKSFSMFVDEDCVLLRFHWILIRNSLDFLVHQFQTTTLVNHSHKQQLIVLLTNVNLHQQIIPSKRLPLGCHANAVIFSFEQVNVSNKCPTIIHLLKQQRDEEEEGDDEREIYMM